MYLRQLWTERGKTNSTRAKKVRAEQIVYRQRLYRTKHFVTVSSILCTTTHVCRVLASTTAYTAWQRAFKCIFTLYATSRERIYHIAHIIQNSTRGELFIFYLFFFFNTHCAPSTRTPPFYVFSARTQTLLPPPLRVCPARFLSLPAVEQPNRYDKGGWL